MSQKNHLRPDGFLATRFAKLKYWPRTRGVGGVIYLYTRAGLAYTARIKIRHLCCYFYAYDGGKKYNNTSGKGGLGSFFITPCFFFIIVMKTVRAPLSPQNSAYIAPHSVVVHSYDRYQTRETMVEICKIIAYYVPGLPYRIFDDKYKNVSVNMTNM